ncbi:hypothetical protein SELMODRAFT_407283 [Selaginella moellendorffii]|uniref:Glycosyl hydrolase family 32 N-terminal domain-containing protein n=1 Tax=Selaginella moellendorffii TaxID=88036 RepID=D8R4I5_SELML|nr:hypothetical protein SELMODRAFT_407283 [Selaginella moellendorffii]
MVLGFHFQAPPNSSIWMISPNAPVFYRGFYHLFYRFTTPSSSKSKNQSSWGHAIAKDLLHWTHLPAALDPGPERICISLLLARPDFFVEWLRRSKELVLELVKVLLGIRGDPFLVLTRRSGGHDNVLRRVGIEPSPVAALQKSVQALREKLEKGKKLLGDHVKRLLTNRWDLREWQ